jgi:hypothetical protein
MITKLPCGPKIFQMYLHVSFQDLPKYTQIAIFGMKMYHLATMMYACTGCTYVGMKSLVSYIFRIIYATLPKVNKVLYIFDFLSM